MTKDTKTARFELRLTEAQKETLMNAAKVAQCPLANYMLSRLLPETAERKAA